MNDPARLLDQAAADLRRMLSADAVPGLTEDAKMRLLRAAGEVSRLVEAVVVETVASVDGRPAGSGEVTFCSRFGCRTLGELLQRALRTDAAGAGRAVAAGRLMRREVEFTTGALLPARWPQMREALLSGAVGVAGVLAATGPLEQAAGRIGTVDRLEADAELAGYAQGWSAVDEDAMGDGDGDGERPPGPAATPEDLRLLAQAIVTHLDPDGAVPAEDIAMRARGLVLGHARHGVIPIRGSLLPETAGQLQRIWDAYLNPRVDGPPLPGRVAFSETDTSAAATIDRDESFGPGEKALLPDEDATGLIDTRSRAQKQHDALTAVLGIAARHHDMPSLGGAAPTLLVSVTAQDYATGRGWAHVDGIDSPVSITTARHTACGGSVQRVLFDPEGRIIGIGSTDRIFTTAQRRAIVLRDRQCLIPGCHVPATWCEIHHVQEHAAGGPTHTDNGVALCWHHHRTLDISGWEIRMDNGIPHVRGPDWWDPRRAWRTPPPQARPHSSRASLLA
ncbi:DUF222 domain-containing protein [Microbacterium sp. 179-I 3D4 NHS]|uniref:HNH endonuclease signature motif containing protein n=1 Tax=Microbacterium sp. 179-I 3D4 NHS TaxID=3142381 RepID=UPI0039A2D24D